jgi:hypothetical protein
MIDRVLFDWAPVTVAVVGIAVALDWLLTHAGARASRRVRDVWASDGSYEMNPTWQDAVDSGRRFSWRLVGAAAVLVAALLAVRYLLTLADLGPAFFAVAAGAILLVQAPIFMAHVSNLQTFRALADPRSVSGQIRFHRPFLYAQSGWHFARYAVLWLLLWLPSQQAFFLGGVLGCFVLARRMFSLGAAATSSTPATAAPAADVAPDSVGP